MMIRCLKLLIFLFLPSLLAAQYSTLKQSYTSLEPSSSSMLAAGTWFKFKIRQSGIYKLTYEDISGMGFSNPAEVRIYGNGGVMQPLINGEPRYDDLIENTIYMEKGTDGTFNQGDYILFYCQGTVTWEYNPVSAMFEHRIHQYSDAAYYFVTTQSGEGRRLNNRGSILGTPAMEINSFDDYGFHEKNKYNFLGSGRQWFGERVDFSPFDSVFVFHGLITTVPVKIKVNVASRSEFNKVFSINSSSTFLGNISISPVNLQVKTGAYANQKSAIYSLNATGDEVPIRISYTKTGSEDAGYVDYITVNAQRRLSFTGDVMFFRNYSIAGTGAIARFNLENSNPQTEVWDISDPFNISRVPGELSGSRLTFTDSTSVLKEYVAVRMGASFPKPELNIADDDIGIIPNQNLHATGPHQMLIVTHPLFTEAADSIAEFHRQKDNLSVTVATTEQIYNEFSSGAPDVSAIRDFARLLYNRATGDHNRLKYLLFIGDGSYNNLSRNKGNANYILTYQSENSLNASFSYVSDDFFGLMEELEGGTANMEEFSLDLGVGRLPVKTAEEAMTLYRKIKNYNNHKGDWQNNIMFVGDDEDGNLHMRQADEIASWVDENYPVYAVKKVFLDAYPQESSSTGTSYPEVNRIIINNIEKGLLIFNYTGHGGVSGLADEHILMREDLEKLTNKNHLPLFITATCEFSRFDDLTREEDGTLTESTSAGEFSILNPNGGCIGLITTTRIVYSSENHELNTRFYQIALSKDSEGKYYPFGDVMRMTKNTLGESRNKLNFILLGDPALTLAIPALSVVTDSVNHVPVTEPVDTLKAFMRIRIAGHIEDNDTNLMSSYNGIIYPSVFDKAKTITSLGNDNKTTPMVFTTREDLLYKGKASVVNGRFVFEFLVPKDITYNYGNGRIVYYSSNDDNDAHGEYSNFIIGGTDHLAETDLLGPDIELYLNDEYFNNQGITNTSPVIFAKIQDESGINTIGNGIGHDITGVIDGNVSHPIVMNDYFETELDDYTAGQLSYQMINLEEGVHSLKLKVWDVYNNSSESTLEFRVIAGNKILISKAGNYPNPARDRTTFTFEHNKPDEELLITISVYDLGGRLLFDYSENVFATGFNASLPEWNLKDLNGNMLKQGIYPYRIRVSDSNGSYTDSFRKLVVVR